MENKIAPIIGRSYGGGHLHTIYEFTAALNGTGVMASSLADALKILTQQNNLHLLTLLPWAELIPQKKLLRRRRAWCSSCYEDWCRASQPIYEPLLWHLEVIQVCPHHRQLLQQICPHCHQENFPLSWRSRPGYCAKCLKWLGSDGQKTQIDLEQQLTWLVWIANAVGELISSAPTLNTFPTKECIAQSLSQYVNLAANGNTAEFARQIQVPRNTVWLWCKGRNLPQLEALLKICYCLNISLLHFLTHSRVDSDPSILRVPLLSSPASRAEAKQIDLEQLEQYLLDTLLRHECPPLSMEAVAKKIGQDRRTILRHFPTLCRAISTKFLCYRKAAQLKAIAQCCEEVRQTVLDLHSQNLYPSEARVAKQLSRPGFLRYEKVRGTLHQCRSELRT